MIDSTSDVYATSHYSLSIRGRTMRLTHDEAVKVVTQLLGAVMKPTATLGDFYAFIDDSFFHSDGSDDS